MIGSASRELPRYKCHKEVWALKIAEIRSPGQPKFTGPTCRGSYALGSACGHCERCEWERNRLTEPATVIVPADAGYLPFPVDHDYITKHKPQIGGYYVVYEDGYKSFSPAKAFEDGYVRVQ